MLLSLTLSGCGQSKTPEQRSPVSGGEDATALKAFYRQEPTWVPCEDGKQCAKVEVPLEYADPDGRRIELALLKSPATDSTRRIGSLLVNPGGPGDSGVRFAVDPSWATPEVRARYDIVGFDPRGVGSSSPIVCMDSSQVDHLDAEQRAAEAAGDRSRLLQLARDYSDSCRSTFAWLLPHIGTENVAADLDILRAVLKDDKLHFYGHSYGTLIGQYYAERFPDKVGRMVLDSLMDASLSQGEFMIGVAESLDTVFENFVKRCLAETCPLGDDAGAVRDKVVDMIGRATAAPLSVEG
ncbi:Putative hydrolase [Nocardia seriolae]|uniref:Hydrolase n=2 Tax=Nocardia seriolae TaxID=37332 RepID=A0ABC8AQ78_9NOCA|nr:Putative hydrolase [Nocardia seriolae]